MRPIIVLGLVLFAAFGSARAADLVGVPVITDGDTVIVAGEKIRLQGIDAPETDQICLNTKGSDWQCGLAARDALIAKAGHSTWRCAISGKDAYRRSLGQCSVGNTDINNWMVEQGWALAFVRYSDRYVADQEAAMRARKGLWAGAFIAPWDWRRRNCKTEVLSLGPVSLEAHRRLCGSPPEPPSAACTIKGNLKRDECIYHLPTGRHYGKLEMEGPRRRWFCSEDEALAAGCRRAKN